MSATPITLDPTENELLLDVARRTGKPHEELLREALSLLAARYDAQDRLTKLRQARGIWRDRTDLPELGALRGEFDRMRG
jgi:hypothetical protein